MKSLLLVGGLFLAVTVGAGWLYTRNALFRLSAIEVETSESDLRAQVRAALVGQLGRSLLSLSLRDLEQTLLDIPRVERVTLHRRWPSTLSVSLQIRPAVALAFRGERLWTIDTRGRPIEVMRVPEAFPLLKNFYREQDNGKLKLNEREATEFFAWLTRAEREDAPFIDFDKVHEVEWNNDRGVILRSAELDLEMEMGTHNFQAAWERLNVGYGFANSQGLAPTFLDATYRSRVVMRSAAKLQNSQSGLNSKGLVRRNQQLPAAAR